MQKRHAITTALAYVFLGVFFGLERRLRQSQQATSLEAGAFDRKSTQVIGAALLVSLLAVLLAPVINLLKHGRHTIPAAAGWLGLGLMGGGIGLRSWANSVLGASYTRTLRVSEGQRLVDRGPYRLLRHPGYTGSLLLWIGGGLATANWLTLSLVALLTGGAYAYRVHSEEAMLAQSFGSAFQEYRQRTWKLIPLIY